MQESNGDKVSRTLTDLKRDIFFQLLELTGRVFILVRYSADVLIGERGFLPEEREKGMVLVFSHKMRFDWDDSGISATLGFGAKTERCFIPPDDIISVFSPDLSAQFSVSPFEEAAKAKKTAQKEQSPSKEKVIKVDFGKKNTDTPSG